jgi:hypothetical protein
MRIQRVPASMLDEPTARRATGRKRLRSTGRAGRGGRGGDPRANTRLARAAIKSLVQERYGGAVKVNDLLVNRRHAVALVDTSSGVLHVVLYRIAGGRITDEHVFEGSHSA